MISIKEQQQIDNYCETLVSLGIKGMQMSMIFNDGSNFVLAKSGSLFTSGIQEGFYEEIGYQLPERIAASTKIYLNREELLTIAEKLCSALDPAYHLIRQQPECAFVFSAIPSHPRYANQTVYERISKRFEAFCLKFVDNFLELLMRANNAYRFSFFFSCESMRHAIIKQGYDYEITLSPREKECLWHAVQGKSAKQIAQALGISPFTVEKTLSKLRELFNCQSITLIMVECMHRGIFGAIGFFEQIHLRQGTLANPLQQAS